jgi:hypothetical protein
MVEFVSLTSVLEPWFETALSELPDADAFASAVRGSRQAGGLNFLLSLWDGLPPARRRTMAAQFDASRDPANEDAGAEEYDLVARLFDLEADLKDILIGPTTDAARRQERRDDLSRQIGEIKARQRELATGSPPLDATPRGPTDAEVERRNRRGPRPIKTNGVVAKMLLDYAGLPDRLAGEKQESLKSLYAVSRDTAEKARRQALEKLQQNSDKTPINDK